MKRIVKVIALISVICIIVTMFSGCNLISELRENRVFLNENGDLVHKDAVYKKLENSDELHFEYNYADERTYYVLKKDEPILYGPLSSRFCDISADKIFIDYYDEGIYCREDKYEYVKERIKKGFIPEKYIYTYDVEIDSDGWFDSFTYETKIHYMTDFDMKIINEIFAHSRVLSNSSDFGYNNDYWVEIYECSEDLLFRRQSFDILSLDGKYYLQKWYNNEVLVYEVPKAHNKTFEKIIKDYVDSENLFYSE